MIDDSFAKVSGMLCVSNAADMSMSRESFYKYVKTNNYEKVGPGMYVSPNDFADELYILHKRCPNGVISHDAALFHYGLIDREPANPTITVYSGYNASRLIKAGYQVFYVDKTQLDLGKTEVVDNFGNTIPMYDLERTIIDMIRNRKKFEIQDYTSALKGYAKRADKNLRNLSEYANRFKVEKVLGTYMEVLL